MIASKTVDHSRQETKKKKKKTTILLFAHCITQYPLYNTFFHVTFLILYNTSHSLSLPGPFPQAASTGGYISSPSQSGSQSHSLTQSLSFHSPTGKGGFPNRQGGPGPGPGSQEKGSSGKKPPAPSSSTGGVDVGGLRRESMGDRSGSASSIQRLNATAPASTFATPTNPITGEGGYGRTSLSSAFTGDDERSLSAYGYDGSEGYASDKTPVPTSSSRDRLHSQQQQVATFKTIISVLGGSNIISVLGPRVSQRTHYHKCPGSLVPSNTPSPHHNHTPKSPSQSSLPPLPLPTIITP